MRLLSPGYAELHCLSNFSFLRGASHPQELVERAHELKYRALAITDECSVAGVVRAHETVRKLPPETRPKLIIGSEFCLEDGLKLVLLAADRTGYGHLCTLITRGRMREEKGRYSLSRGDLGEGLPGCLAILIPPALPAANPPSPFTGEGWGVREGWDDALGQARFVADCFAGRAWIAAGLFCGPNDRSRLAGLRELSSRFGLPLVAAGDVHMHVRSRRPLQDVVTAIRLGVPVQQAGYALHPNAERHLRHPVRLGRIYPPELLAETLRIAERCDFSLDSLRYEYPDEIVPPGRTPATYLRELTEEGLRRRFPHGMAEKVRSQVETELALIRELRYEPYFLTVYDVVRFARSQGILCQGRGSAANSAVCYALGITEVDPGRQNLLFERFLSRERNEPPDIDVDFEHQRREEVIQYIYGKYGRDRAALAATLITYQPRSAVRDVGKALGMELAQVDRLARSLAWWDRPDVMRMRLQEAGFDPRSDTIRLLLALLDALIGFPRHLSQHVGGFVISRGPLSRLVPVENAAMAGRSVIQWDKDDLETLGLLKVDVLALGMLSAIQRTLTLVNSHRRSSLTMQEILLDRQDDPAVFEMIRAADTIGVFQIESRAQMSMLPRLKPRQFYDLVIEIAIVRPGPIQGDMVHPYLKCRQMDPADIVYENEEIRGVLGRTLGVPIFQEQVMHLAMVAAGFTPDEADGLRRSMAAWRRRGRLEKYQQKLKEGMGRKGYSAGFTEKICRQIEGFGEYGFPESHSASFALLAYVSSWLKYYEPAAFLAATLNSQPMGFYSPSTLVQDARRHGVEVRPVDVTLSDWECTLEPGIPSPESRLSQPAVRLGLLMVKGLSRAGADGIVPARAQKPFVDVADMARRAGLNRRDLNALAAAGALASLSAHRREAHWLNAGLERQSALLEDTDPCEPSPLLRPPTEGEEIVADYESTGLTLGRHPLALLRRRLRRMRLSTATELKDLPSGAPARGAGLVTCRQRPGTSRGVVFVTLEDETGHLNVVVWNSLVERQRRELLNSRLLGVEGVMQKEGDVVHLVAHRLTDHTALLGRLATESRDFH
jgi:error-prone DNA polymerase